MAQSEAEQEKTGSRIEGGIDAIVLGADADGLTAAAYLGKAGLRTVLVEAGAVMGGAVRKRPLAGGVEIVEGEHLAAMLDPEAIADLELYRHGLSYAARRLDTTYFFENDGALRLDGDWSQAANLMDWEEKERERLAAFLTSALEIAKHLRPTFDAAFSSSGDTARAKALQKTLSQAVSDRSAQIARYAIASVEDVIGEQFGDGPIKTLLISEAAFRAGAAPHEAFSFMAFIRRLAGEISGLQGAVAYPAGGAISVIDALRRAAQTSKVDIRAATPAESILIEGDQVAGVVLKGGGQLRAPVVIASLEARRVFLEMIGPDKIDIEFQRLITQERPSYASVRLQAVLKGVAKDEQTRENITRRIMLALAPDALRSAFLDAREGVVPKNLLLEILFPGALDPNSALEQEHLISVMAHPLPFDKTASEKRRNTIRKTILSNLEKVIPDAEDRLGDVDLSLPCGIAGATDASPAAYAAKPPVMRQWALAGACVRAGRIGGLYFCGPEAQIGAGLSFAAGRAAAKAALRDMKRA